MHRFVWCVCVGVAGCGWGEGIAHMFELSLAKGNHQLLSFYFTAHVGVVLIGLKTLSLPAN